MLLSRCCGFHGGHHVGDLVRRRKRVAAGEEGEARLGKVESEAEDLHEYFPRLLSSFPS